MKRFLVFSYQDYYPLGGAADFKVDADTLEEAQGWLENNYFCCANVLDTKTGDRWGVEAERAGTAITKVELVEGKP